MTRHGRIKCPWKARCPFVQVYRDGRTLFILIGRLRVTIGTASKKRHARRLRKLA